MSRRGLPFVALLVWLGSIPAAADKPEAPPPEQRIFHRNLLVARVNPVGLIYEGRITFRRRLYLHDSPALRDNYVAVGLAPSLSPAFARLGAVVEVQPASVVQLWAMYEAVGYYGTFNHLQSFASPSENHADSLLDARADLPDGDPLRNYSTTGGQLTLGATLQAKVGPVAVRNQARFIRPDLKLRGADGYYYDVLHDVLAQNRGWFLTNDLDVLHQTGFGLTAGIRWNTIHGFYGGDVHNGNTPTHRVGPLLAYTFWTKGGDAKFDTPTVILIANWWLAHRYRTGLESSRAFPYVALGFAFTGDLLAGR